LKDNEERQREKEQEKGQREADQEKPNGQAIPVARRAA
jgi:hypothetical protein